MLLDINQPDGSGWDVLRALRKVHLRVPTIVLSAVRCNQTRLDEFAPDAYLPKPFPLAALMAAVERLSSRQAAAHAASE
jgi:DNA-binding response OmpR family regulator